MFIKQLSYFPDNDQSANAVQCSNWRLKGQTSQVVLLNLVIGYSTLSISNISVRMVKLL